MMTWNFETKWIISYHTLNGDKSMIKTEEIAAKKK